MQKKQKSFLKQKLKKLKKEGKNKIKILEWGYIQKC
jgi:hypothetical protein